MLRRAWPAKIRSPINQQIGQKGGNAMLAWLRDLTSRERRTMLACWGGWTLDGFDQQLYSYVVPTVIAVWGMSTGAAGTIATYHRGDLVVRRLVCRRALRPLRPRAHAADRNPVVFGLHFPVQLRAEL